jgi:hypothetical protein
MSTHFSLAGIAATAAAHTLMILRRRSPVALAVAALLGAGLVGGARAAQEPVSWAKLDGRDWTRFAPREKQAYVAGFLAGAAAAAADTPDTAGIRRSVDALYRAGGLPFPFGPMVYATRLNEFYWWDNHIPIPLYLALSDINQRLRQPLHDPQSGTQNFNGGLP